MDPIDPAILALTQPLGSLGLSEARLQTDARFSWITLISRGTGLVELEDLSLDERALLMHDIVRASAAVRAIGEALGRPVQKLNVGQLGNLVTQMHVHVIGRRADDPAWPGPVWGFGQQEPYPPQDWETAVAAAKTALGL